MYATIVFESKTDEAKALGILLEHSPGAVYRGPKYVVQEGVLELLHNAGIRFSVLGSMAA